MNTAKKTLGVITMSGDPITKGHLWMVKEALSVFSNVEILIGHNASKKCLFHIDTRQKMVNESLKEYFSDERGNEVLWDEVQGISYLDRVLVSCQHRNDFIAVELEERFEIGYEQVSFVRGLRNGMDMAYEQTINDVNRRVSPGLSTVYLIPPLHLMTVSSSIVKDCFRLNSWQRIADQFVTPCVNNMLKAVLWKETLSGRTEG